MKKKELIAELLNDMQGDICNYEELLFDLAEEALQKYTIRKLKNLLGQIT